MGLEGSEDQRGYGGWDMSWRMKLGQRGWLKPTVLKSLEAGPMNGIEIMNRIQEMSHGWWRPSPGSIYPLLETLAVESLVKKNSDGRYELTSRYRNAYGPMNPSDEVITNMEGNISYLEELSKSDRKAFLAYKQRVAKMISRLSRLK